jgi:hypothetical protein
MQPWESSSENLPFGHLLTEQMIDERDLLVVDRAVTFSSRLYSTDPKKAGHLPVA